MKITKQTILWGYCSIFLFLALTGFTAEKADLISSATLDVAYPGLASSALSFAVLGDLPEGILLRSGDYEIKADTLNSEITKVPETLQEEMKKNQFFLLEQMATKDLLLRLAKTKTSSDSKDSESADENKLIQDYLKETASTITVTDREAADFYQNNKDLCGNTPLEQMKDQIKEYVLQEKQQEAVKEHIRTLGLRTPIVVSSTWTQEQVKSAKNNPVDIARSSGLPSMVDFGASGCRPCDMMTPILADLKKKFEGKVNVLFVHVREQQILAARYGIQSIPVQVFFDKDGKELSRHTGFFPQAEIEKKLAEMGVQ